MFGSPVNEFDDAILSFIGGGQLMDGLAKRRVFLAKRKVAMTERRYRDDRGALLSIFMG